MSEQPLVCSLQALGTASLSAQPALQIPAPLQTTVWACSLLLYVLLVFLPQLLFFCIQLFILTHESNQWQSRQCDVSHNIFRVGVIASLKPAGRLHGWVISCTFPKAQRSTAISGQEVMLLAAHLSGAIPVWQPSSFLCNHDGIGPCDCTLHLDLQVLYYCRASGPITYILQEL